METKKQTRRPKRQQRKKPTSDASSRRIAKRPATHTATYRTLKKSTKDIDAKNPPLRFTPLGGLEEIGQNMSVFEYKDDIFIIDMGLWFGEDATPGIDYVIPNVESLVPKKKNIKGIIITHGHYDHIGAIPHLTTILGGDIPIYAPALAREIIKKRQEEYKNAPKLQIHTVKDGDTIRISDTIHLKVHEIIHTIPDSIALTIHTPVGTMAYCTDLKIDWKKDGTPTGLDAYERMAKEKIHTLFLESTAAEKQGTSLPEEIAHENIEILMKAAEGRVIIGLFASLLNRVAEIIKIAEKLDKKVALSGFSLKTNFNIAQSLGYIKVRKGTIIPLEEISKYKDNQILILSTGAQGEPNASLMKIAHGEHRTVEIKASDTIIFSSSIIPGNEQAIQNLKDDLTRQGARVIQSQHIDVHSSGHGPAGDLKKVIGIIQPQYFVPIHGMYFMRAANVELAKEMGVPKQNSFLIDNGNILDMYADHIDVSDETVASQYVMVDGLGVGDVEEVVLRDRRALAEEGMIVVIATIDRRTGRFLKNPDIISRGFIYLKENKGLIEDMRKRVKLAIQKIPRIQSVETEYIKTLLREQLGQFIFNKTKRRPMILPVIIEV